MARRDCYPKKSANEWEVEEVVSRNHSAKVRTAATALRSAAKTSTPFVAPSLLPVIPAAPDFRKLFPMASNYTEASIKTLSSLEHIRLRPGMYIGRLGNGTHAEDGIYVLLKETIDNCIDEFTMGFGKRVEVELSERTLRVRDFGRGIPLGKLVDCVSIINTGAKYDSETFQKAVGLNGVGQKAVNALSSYYRAQAVRDGQTKIVEFTGGKLTKESKIVSAPAGEKNGTLVEFTPDVALFGQDFRFKLEFIEEMLWNYAYLNRGLAYLDTGEPGKAEFDFNQAIRQRPKDARVWFNRGVAQARQGRFAEAVYSYETALGIEPGNADARRNLEAARGMAGRGGRRPGR